MGISDKCFWKQHCLGKYISVGLCWSVGSLSVAVMTRGLCGGLVSYNLASLNGLVKLSLMLWSIDSCPCCYNMESQERGEKRPLELPVPPPAQCRTGTRSAWHGFVLPNLKTILHGDHSFSEWPGPVLCDPLYK